ncbi:MAG: PIN domain-containing protein, partial [Bradymonadia bacterium]
TKLIEDAVEAGDALYVSEVVLCEVVWVLGRVYRLSKDDLVDILRALVQARELDIQGREGVRRALDAFVRGKGDFPDYLIRELALGAGCDRIATFDKALLGEPEFYSP